MKITLVLTAIYILLTSCGDHRDISGVKADVSNSTLVSKQNKQVALECIRAWSIGNVDKIVSHLAVNTVEFGDESTPPVHGIDSVKQFAQLWIHSVKDYKSDNELAVADSDYVFVYAGWSGTFKNDFMGMKTTGKSFKFKDVDIFKFDNDGKITEHRAVHFSTVLKQLATQIK